MKARNVRVLMGLAVMSLFIISGLLFYYLSPAIPKFVDEAFYQDKPILNASVISHIPNAKIIVTEEEWFTVVSYDSTSLVFYRFTDQLTLDSQILSNLDISIKEDEDTFVMNNGYLYWYHSHEAHGVCFDQTSPGRKSPGLHPSLIQHHFDID